MKLQDLYNGVLNPRTSSLRLYIARADERLETTGEGDWDFAIRGGDRIETVLHPDLLGAEVCALYALGTDLFLACIRDAEPPF